MCDRKSKCCLSVCMFSYYIIFTHLITLYPFLFIISFKICVELSLPYSLCSRETVHMKTALSLRPKRSGKLQPKNSLHSSIKDIPSAGIREYGSTLYVGLARAVPPTNAVTSPDSSRYADHKHSQAQNVIFQVYTHTSSALEVIFPQPDKNRKFL